MHQSNPYSAVPSATPPRRRYALLSTYPPTPCGVATFSAALGAGLASEGAEVGVVRVGNGGRGASGGAPVVAVLDDRDPVPASSALDAMNDADVVVVQHEYGLYAGEDGDAVIGVLEALERPSIVVAHTVLKAPTPHQREVLEAVVDAADAVVVMTEAGRVRLCGGTFDVDPMKVSVIAHGAAVVVGRTHGAARTGAGLLTWGLLGPGKGIEWAIDALAELRDIRPQVRYCIAGDTHPKVLARDGEAYRHMLRSRARALGVAPFVRFDAGYRDLTALATLIERCGLVVLPYDSPDQVTSGVLVDAVAAGRPVVATSFPHAKELLASGAGLVVPRRDPEALADAIRRVLTEPGLHARMAAEARRIAPDLAWPAVAGRYAALGEQLLDRQAAVAFRVTFPERSGTASDGPSFAHLVAMTDGFGTFEHADHAVPRREHGYCLDDVARVLLVSAREPDPSSEVRDLARGALRFVAGAQGVTGKSRNRRRADGRWHGSRGVEDCWGRSLWALGVAATHGERWLNQDALALFEHACQWRAPHHRTTAFAVLGAAEVLATQPWHRQARELLADGAASLPRPTDDPWWPWPEARLTYANALLPDALLAAGAALDDPALVADGLALLGWLLERETRDGHLSVTAAGGAGPGDVGPAFDQQPIEVATMAEACARAFSLTGDPEWAAGVVRAGRWFDGDNDAGTPMWDPLTQGGFDGLEPGGANQNQGAESTLALIATRQLERRFARLAA